MISIRGRLWSSALTIAATAPTVGAQGKDCKAIDMSGSYQMTAARQYISAAEMGKADERPKALRNIVQVLTPDPAKVGNPLGRAWIMGRTMYRWSGEPGVGYTAKRGFLGYTTDVDGTQDILAAMDTAFTEVETLAPACADLTRPMRMEKSSRLINEANALLTLNLADSALVMIRHALYADHSPVGYTVLANVYLKKNDTTSAIEAYKQAIAMPAIDTGAVRLRDQAAFNYAILRTNQAEAAPAGPQKKAFFLEASSLLQGYLKTNPDNAQAKSALRRALAQSGDSAAALSLRGIDAEMLTSPEKFTDIQLFEAGFGASNEKRDADAAKLFEAGLKQNPYYRDGLFNLASTYRVLKEFDKMAPVARRLVEVDPNNPDNWKLLASVYQGLGRTTTDAALKSAYGIDSTVKYIGVSEKVAAGVTFSVVEFRREAARTTIRAKVENHTSGPVNQTVKLSFLDGTGKVVNEQAVPVQLAAGESKVVPLTVPVKGVAAYRYEPLQ